MPNYSNILITIYELVPSISVSALFYEAVQFSALWSSKVIEPLREIEWWLRESLFTVSLSQSI